MGFGGSPFSNFAQRFAHALMWELRRRMDDADQKFDTPTEAKLRQRRTAIRGSDEDAAFYVVDMYTDDSKFTVIGVSRAVRLLELWEGLCSELNVLRARAEKRLAGTTITYLGIRHFTMAGAVVIPEAKRLPALRQLN